MASDSTETTPMLPRRQSSNHWKNLKHKTMLLRTLSVLGLLLGLVVGVWALQYNRWSSQWDDALINLEQEATCTHLVPRVPRTQFADRQSRLFKTMKQEGIFAYIMEPSPTMLYHTNLTWARTERPFLIAFIQDTMTIITPRFEETRAKEQWIKADVPLDAKMVTWEESGSAFDTVRDTLLAHGWHSGARVEIEPTTRYFIAQGIQAAVGPVQLASPAIQHLRSVKTPEEIAIMRCANQITARAILTVQHHGIQLGMTEQAIESRMLEALARVGLSETWVVALVDANAAFPHGQPGQSLVVQPHSLVLIDTGGALLDYQSDTTRTFFMDPDQVDAGIRKAWSTVRQAQQDVLEQVKVGTSCAEVDLVARHVIDAAGWAHAFTHRLGHGIGLEMHEDPYMNQGNTNCSLQVGNTFSVEPGIYERGQFGIRLEDIVVVNADGHLELLTDGLAQSPWN